MADAPDKRNLSQLVRQFQLLEGVKNRLVRAGALSADATTADVEAALRTLIPSDFAEKKAAPSP
jgi:hypothetical protein